MCVCGRGGGDLLTVSVFVSVCTNVVNLHDCFVWGIYSRYCNGKRHHRHATPLYKPVGVDGGGGIY
jgi:hypothetical protein